MVEQQTINEVNGINIDVFQNIINAMQKETEFGQCRFRRTNKWKPVYDELAQVRSQNGVTARRVHQDSHDKNSELNEFTRGRSVILRFLTVIQLILLCNTITSAGVINVPEDHTTIQAGIDASADGDTVLVAPGEYFENINFKGKAIFLSSHYFLDQDPAYISSTIINGSNAQNSNNASVVTLRSGEDANSVLNGFTITGGRGTKYTSEWPRHAGGGIFILSGASITNNHIINNNLIGNNPPPDGGGIHVNSGSSNTIIIRNNLIENNLVSGHSLVTGAGISLWGKADAIISNNTIIGNRVESINPIDENTGGGGLYIADRNCMILNNVFSGNEASFGGAINAWGRKTGSNLRVINNTFVENIASIKGGGIYINHGHCTAINNIFWDNNAPDDPDIFYRGNMNISYSITQDIFPGEGNIQTDPLFDPNEYYLSDASPAIDTGNPDPNFNDTEDSENPGFPLWPAKGTLTADMGAFGGNDTVDVEMEDYMMLENFLFEQFEIMRYRFAYPLNYDSNSLYPLTIVLHGSANWGRDNKEQMYEGLPWRANAEYFGYNEFTILPQAPSSSGWSDDNNLNRVYDLIIDTINNYPIDTNRIVITGWSQGGGGVWRLLSLYPQLFAAAIPVSGINGGFGDITHIPVWVNHGSADNNVSVWTSRNYISKFENAGVTAVYAETLSDEEISEAIDDNARLFYSEFEGAGHFIVKQAYDNYYLFEWLKKQSRQ
jgi:poly(3-hydroxybutyrate) depolymerase